MGGNKSTLRPEVVKDLEETTAFTQTEITDLYRQYVHDCQGNLKMTKKQFISMYEEIFPNGEATAFAEHVFMTFDKDEKGVICFRQFMTTLSIQLKGSLEEKLHWAFDLYDFDHNGSISRDETMEMLQVLKNMHAGHIPHEDNISVEQLTDHMFRRGETENQDTITRKQFVHAAMSSKTMQAILQGTFSAAAEPFVIRKERSGSFGRPRSNSRHSDGSRSPRYGRSPSNSFSDTRSDSRRDSTSDGNFLQVYDNKSRSNSFK